MDEQEQNLEYYEIDLMDYVKVIYKRKRWIFLIFLVAVGAAFAFTTYLPETYQTKAVLRVGQIQGDKLEAPQETVTVLEQQSTLKEIANGVEFEQKPTSPAAAVDGLLDFKKPEKSNLVVITAKSSSPRLVYDGAKTAANVVIDRHQNLFNKREKLLEEKISNTKQEIETYKNEVEQLSKQIKNFRNYNYSEGQGLALQGYLASLRVAQNRVDSAKNRLNNLQLQKTNSKNTRIIARPTRPESPTGPNMKLNLAIAAVLGLFIGVFWVFLLEWWQKNKDKL